MTEREELIEEILRAMREEAASYGTCSHPRCKRIACGEKRQTVQGKRRHRKFCAEHLPENPDANWDISIPVTFELVERLLELEAKAEPRAPGRSVWTRLREELR